MMGILAVGDMEVNARAPVDWVTPATVLSAIIFSKAQDCILMYSSVQ